MGLPAAGALCLLAVVGLVAALRPAWRATRTDPMAVLRGDERAALRPRLHRARH